MQKFTDLKKSVLLDAAKNLSLKVIFDEGRFITISDGSKECSFVGVAPETTSLYNGVLSNNKYITNIVLKNTGIPVLPFIKSTSIEEIEDFLLENKEIVIKPVNGTFSRGLVMHITEVADIPKAIKYALDNAKKRSAGILIQRQAAGDDHRLLVVGKKDVYALRKSLPQLVGDGVSTVQELLNRENNFRELTYGTNKVIAFDESIKNILNNNNFDQEHILKKSEVLLLDTITDFDAKRISENVTDSICDKARDMSIQIAKEMQMDVIGIDIISEDITDNNVDMYVLEVNNSPGLRWHVQPRIGDSIHVGEKILEYVFNIKRG